eukprot:Clim_evm9s215 gene=Clim_evmTU9s215
MKSSAKSGVYPDYSELDDDDLDDSIDAMLSDEDHEKFAKELSPLRPRRRRPLKGMTSGRDIVAEARASDKENNVFTFCSEEDSDDDILNPKAVQRALGQPTRNSTKCDRPRVNSALKDRTNLEVMKTERQTSLGSHRRRVVKDKSVDELELVEPPVSQISDVTKRDSLLDPFSQQKSNTDIKLSRKVSHTPATKRPVSKTRELRMPGVKKSRLTGRLLQTSSSEIEDEGPEMNTQQSILAVSPSTTSKPTFSSDAVATNPVGSAHRVVKRILLSDDEFEDQTNSHTDMAKLREGLTDSSSRKPTRMPTQASSDQPPLNSTALLALHNSYVDGPSRIVTERHPVSRSPVVKIVGKGRSHNKSAAHSTGDVLMEVFTRMMTTANAAPVCCTNPSFISISGARLVVAHATAAESILTAAHKSTSSSSGSTDSSVSEAPRFPLPRVLLAPNRYSLNQAQALEQWNPELFASLVPAESQAELRDRLYAMPVGEDAASIPADSAIQDCWAAAPDRSEPWLSAYITRTTIASAKRRLGHTSQIIWQVTHTGIGAFVCNLPLGSKEDHVLVWLPDDLDEQLRVATPTDGE